MKTSLLLRLPLFLTLGAGCHKKDHPAPLAGPITFDRIAQVTDLVHPHADWDEAIAEIAAKAGAPTVKTETRASWALSDGASCAQVTIERKADHVASVSSQRLIRKADFGDAPNNFTECEAIAKAN